MCGMQSMCWHPVVPLPCSSHKLDHCLFTAMVLVLDVLWCHFANYLFISSPPSLMKPCCTCAYHHTQSRWGRPWWCMHSAIHRHAWNLSLHQNPATLAAPLFSLPRNVHSIGMPPCQCTCGVSMYATASPERLCYYPHPRMALLPLSAPRHTCCSLHIVSHLHVYALCTKHSQTIVSGMNFVQKLLCNNCHTYLRKWNS